jgi:hypothetical protein
MRLKDFFSLERYKSVLIWLLRTLLNKLDGGNALEVFHVEQYMYRLLRCNSCVLNGSCLDCGCKIPAKMFVRTDYCSDGKWLPFMDEKTWNEYKIENNIKFTLNEQ